jgi:hypothetical protein
MLALYCSGHLPKTDEFSGGTGSLLPKPFGPLAAPGIQAQPQIYIYTHPEPLQVLFKYIKIGISFLKLYHNFY